METAGTIITQTKKWINQVVVGCNFCPFAAKVVKNNRIGFIVEMSGSMETCLQSFIQECFRMNMDDSTETSFVIYTGAFTDFDSYLDLVSLAEALLEKEGYEGIYQVASFHPEYCFEDADENDPANYTNRSPYPMLHILREAVVTKALEHYKEPENIPENNIRFARQKGIAFMRLLKEACMEV